MKILLTGGGTAGHIHPALAIAAILEQRLPGVEFLFVGAQGRLETTLVPAAGYRIETVNVQGFQRRVTVKNIAAAWHVFTSAHEAGKIIKDFHPDLAIGTGGYVCGPVLHAAIKAHVPVLLHESNALPGVTVKMLAKDAAAVMLADPAAKAHLPAAARTVVTGNPLRRAFYNADKAAARAALSLDSRPFVLSYGGSMGARPLNEAMAGLLVMMSGLSAGAPWQHLHAAGKAGYPAMCALLDAKKVAYNDGGPVRIVPYLDNMPGAMIAADAVVCRAGAMTLSELAAAGVPAVLIPSPYVAENHQYHNAQAVAARGAAQCIEEKNVTPARLRDTLSDILTTPGKATAMAAAARAAAILDAPDRIFDVVMETLGKRS
ncbi:MAG: undecaprenyldiphospho-muramoylpentapeptide beta-N-acetylglucosaminyltransferase [Oscillospiraceae bacterium]|nr:undecaprenyldiphospho-muramoylpentapeptide beta-N-acetylglucosaminyltransferase [Oscillospiraceae bacterium]